MSREAVISGLCEPARLLAALPGGGSFRLLAAPRSTFFSTTRSLFTVAQARRSASFEDTPRFSQPSSICSACRFLLTRITGLVAFRHRFPPTWLRVLLQLNLRMCRGRVGYASRGPGGVHAGRLRLRQRLRPWPMRKRRQDALQRVRSMAAGLACAVPKQPAWQPNVRGMCRNSHR